MKFISVIIITTGIIYIGFVAKAHAQKMSATMEANLLAVGKVYGDVVDSASGKPIPFASISIINTKDSTGVAGVLSSDKGEFHIEEVPSGMFRLAVTSVGFRTYISSPFQITPQSTVKDFDIIKLSSSINMLKDVIVTADKNDFINQIDRKVYNVDKNIVNIGGTAAEVLQNIPSVTVDMDGIVSLRGSANVTVLIDGRPSTLTGSSKQAILQQIPASIIDRIEVITNPSAKYDAEGMAGIINIITKKGKLVGTNINASLGEGTRDKYNAALGFNNRSDKFNLYGNYTYRHETRTVSSYNYRNISYSDTAFSNTINSQGANESDASVGKLGLDFFPDQYNTFGISGTYSYRKDNKTSQWLYENLNTSQADVYSWQRNDMENYTTRSTDLNINYKRKFRNSKTELSANATYSQSNQDATRLYQDYFPDSDAPNIEQSVSGNNYSVFTAQTDLLIPINSVEKLEAGLKSTTRQNDNDVNATLFDNATQTYINDSLYSNHFNYREQVNAAYAQYTSRFMMIDFQGGMRAEQTHVTGDFQTSGIIFTRDYVDLFPNAFLKYDLDKKNELKLSYSRRVDRPYIAQLNPFIDYSDSLNIKVGNPYLKPEYVNSYELNYMNSWAEKRNSLSVTIYYRSTENYITRFRSLDTTTNITVLTYSNFSSASDLGAEMIMHYQLGKAGSVMLSSNIYQSTINGSNVEAGFQNQTLNWSTLGTLNLRVLKNTSFQVTGMYMAPVIQPQGSFRGLSGVDGGVRQDILKGNGSLSFNVTDIFNTRKYIIMTNGYGFTYNTTLKPETRIAMLTFSYRFGKADAKIFQNKKNPQQHDDSNPQMEDF